MRLIIYIFILSVLTGPCFGQGRAFTVQFDQYANGKKISLNDEVFTNAFNETYRISKLKYYISDIHLVCNDAKPFRRNVYLINAAASNEISLPVSDTAAFGIEFLVGVDSLLNCSGAQEGALDPWNDMFWTWNSGYVMFKLEGSSDISPADQHRIELHIGGYKGVYKTMKNIFLPMSRDEYKTYLRTGCIIRLDLDKFWNGRNKIHIAQQPVLTVPGAEAALVAGNFADLFSITATEQKN